MPDATPIRKFAESLRSGRTDVTKALDKLVAERDPTVVAVLRTAILSPLDENLKKALLAQGVNEKELDHIDTWPDAQKEDLRQKILGAIEAGRAVRFLWELHRGDNEGIDIIDPDGKADVTVYFQSPQSKVKVPARGTTLGSISVGV